MNVDIRRPTVDDAAALVALIKAHAVYERATACCEVSDIAALLECNDPPAHILLAMLNGDAVGYAAITLDFSLWRCRNWAHMDCLFVAENYRGSGIGAALFDATKGYALNVGVNFMEWQTPDWNTDAARFYVRQGAVQVSKSRFSLLLQCGN